MKRKEPIIKKIYPEPSNDNQENLSIRIDHKNNIAIWKGTTTIKFATEMIKYFNEKTDLI
jgi:hypothetical protein